jgi:CDP-diacylglycerol---serine O-phosphatidyltransferase
VKKLIAHIPNTLTCLNLVCGCVGIVFVLQGNGTPAAWFVWAACVFDFFDGFAARWLKVSSAIGKELDSLADMVSFGVLPSMLMFRWLSAQTENQYLPYVAFLLAVFSALRLAKFNIDERQTSSFIGLPTPANALFITALPFLPGTFLRVVEQPWVLVLIIVLFSLLLVAEIELFALKFKNFGWQGNQLRFVFLAMAAVLLLIFQQASLPLIILLYIVLSFGKSRLTKAP